MATTKKPPPSRTQAPPALPDFVDLYVEWSENPAKYVHDVLGGEPDPWQCDVMDAVLEFNNVAMRASHGVGKTMTLAWLIVWFTTTRKFAVVPTTAPTFNKQVRDVLWAQGVGRVWRQALECAPWLDRWFELTATRLPIEQAEEAHDPSSEARHHD